MLVATPASSHGSTGRQRLLHPVQPGTGIHISDVVLGQLPGVERLDGTLRARRRAAGFTDFPLLISGLEAFNTLIISSAVSAASAPLLQLWCQHVRSLVQCFQWSEHQSNRNFAVLGNMRQAVACTTRTYSKWAVPPRITVPSAITACIYRF